LKVRKTPAGTGQAQAGYNRKHKPYSVAAGRCQYHRVEVLANGGYTVIPDAILHDDDLTAPEKLSWIALAAYQRSNDWSWPSITRLSFVTRLSKRTVKRTLKGLESKGYLKRKRRHGTTSLYQLFYRPEQDHSKSRVNMASLSPELASQRAHNESTLVERALSPKPVSEHDRRQSEATMTPLSPESRSKQRHSKSGAIVTPRGRQSGPGGVSQRHPEKEEMNKKKEEEKADSFSPQTSSPAPKLKPEAQTPPIKGDEKLRDRAADILCMFCLEADLKLPETDFNLQPIIDRLREGWTPVQLEAVARLKGAEWSTPSMRANQKPYIVFSAKNIARYVEEAAHIVQAMEEEYQLATELWRLKETGQRLKAKGATEEELDQLRAKYAMTRARWQSACDRVETLVSQHRPDWWKRQEREEEWE